MKKKASSKAGKALGSCKLTKKKATKKKATKKKATKKKVTKKKAKKKATKPMTMAQIRAKNRDTQNKINAAISKLAGGKR